MVLLADEELPASEAPSEEQAAPAAAEPSTPQEMAMALLEKAKKNLPVIIGVVVLLAVIYVYLFVLPKPGTLTISVFELDMGDKAFSDAEIEIKDDGGNVVATPILEDGEAKAVGVPSGKLTVEVTPSNSAYETAEATVNLASGGSASAEIYVPKKSDLQITAGFSNLNIGEGCSKTFSLPVRNNGDAAFDTELVAEGEDFNKAFSYEGMKTLESKSAGSISFTVSASEGTSSVSGKIRIKYTDAGTEFSANVVEAPDMRVDPSDISIRCREGGCEDVQVTINNYGKSDLTDISYQLAGGVTESDVEIVGFESKAIRPNSRTTFFVRGKAAGIGKVGKLKIMSGCGEEELPLSIKSG